MLPPATGHRGPAVCKLVGVTYRQLDYWARTDLVRPSINDAHGIGNVRLYSDDDVFILRVIKCALDCGLSLHAVRRLVEGVRDNLDAYWAVFTGSDNVVLLNDYLDLATWFDDCPTVVAWVLKLAQLRGVAHSPA